MTLTANHIIEIHTLHRSFGKETALENINIQIQRGQVVGIIGENGAGKTTLIKHLLGLLKAQKGSVSVFGLDPVTNPVEVLSNIGYLSEQPELPEWMTINEYMNYMSAFYKNWDNSYANELLKTVAVNTDKKIAALSKGQKARIALCAAQAYRPELLLFDEPSSGLDPIVRKEILSAVIRTVSSEGRTVVFSSHLLDEIERVCDHLLMIHKGKVIFSSPMENVLNQHFSIMLKGKSKADLQKINGYIHEQEKNGELELNVFADMHSIQTDLAEKNIEILNQRRMSLDEIFFVRSQVAAASIYNDNLQEIV